MKEFIFGTLSTVEQRVAHAQAQKSGVKHLHRLTPRAPRAGDAPVVTVTVALPQPVERIVCELSQPETAVIDLHCHQVEWDLLNWRYYQVWQGTLPPQTKGALVRYQVKAYPQDGRPPILADDGTTFSYLVGDPAAPAWTAEAIVYQIFPDRFYPGNGRTWNETTSLDDIYGGTLRGIIDRLDYVADLGFNCIWLNPFFPDHTHHGYHATDYFAVNPRLGTLDDIRELIHKAHDKGIRLLLDFVANHWGSSHETFQDALANQDSPYRDWYTWHEWPHQYETFFDVKDLPQVNVEHPQARAYLLRSVRYWLGEIGFDGLRLDYVLGPSHDFWTELRMVAKETNPDAWLFGEAVETPVMQRSYEGRLDGCLDFLLAQALRETFALESMSVAAFDNFLAQHEEFFPPTFGRPSFLDNHDLNRFLWLAGEDKRKLKLSALCQFTLMGSPIVYQGTEVGVSQQKNMWDPDSQGMVECRQPMAWGDAQDEDLHAYYKWLIHFRRQHPVLARGQRRTIHLDDNAGTYVYARFDESQTILVALNLSEERRTITVMDPVISEPQTFALSPWNGDVRALQSG